jgi:hypothetical protein
MADMSRDVLSRIIAINRAKQKSSPTIEAVSRFSSK